MTGVRNLYAQRLAKRGFVSEPFQWLAGWLVWFDFAALHLAGGCVLR